MKLAIRFALLLFAVLAIWSQPALAQKMTTPSDLLSEINSGGVDQGCRLAAHLTVESLKKIGIGACAIPEPTGTTKLACAVGYAVKNDKFAEVAVKGTTEGCMWVVEKAADGVVKITVTVSKETQNTAKELKAWLNFLNTFEGTLWFMNKLGGP